MDTGGPRLDQLQEHLREFLEGVQVKGCVQKALQLCQVGLLVASGWSGCWVSASIPDRLSTVNGGPKSWLDIVIVALVLVLFLAPGQLSIGILLCLSQQEVEGEW